MTGFSDIFNNKPKPATMQQAVPRQNKKVRRGLLDILLGPSPSAEKPQVPQYPVIKPMPGIETRPVRSATPMLDRLSRLFGIKPDRSPLENLQEQIQKEKPHGETLIRKVCRKLHIVQNKEPIMPSRATILQKHPTRGVVLPTRITPSTVRSINSPIARNSFLGKLVWKKSAKPVMATYVKPAKPEEKVAPKPRPRNPKEWLIAFRENAATLKFPAILKGSSAAQTIPVISRRGVYGVPIHKQTQTRVRRQLYLSLGKSGAEIRVPALPIFNPSWRIISGLLSSACLAALFYLLYAPQFMVTSVEVKGLNRLDPERIQPILDLANRPIVFLDADLIKSRVSQVLPELKDIRVSIDLPATISITLGERKPALAWEYNDQVNWIDTDGILIPVQGDGGELLTIRADVPPPVWDISERKEIIKAYAAAGVQFERKSKSVTSDSETRTDKVYVGNMQQVEPAVLATAVQLSMMMPVGAQLIYDSNHGFGWNDQLQNLTVYIGQDLDYLDVKLYEYSSILITLQKDGIRPGMISLEHVHAPFYRLERQ